MKLAFVIFYSILLILPLILCKVDFNGKKDKIFASHEGRYRKDLSSLKNASPDEFFDEFEKWFKDNFGLRKKILELNCQLHKLLKLSPKPEKVIRGRNNWLYLGDSNNHIHSNLQGRLPFLEDEKQEWLNYFKRRSDELENKNIVSIVVITPEKQTIYPEHLYKKDRYNLSKKSRTDMISEAEKNFYCLNLQDILLTNKEMYVNSLYNFTDSHWSTLGAFIGYSEIMLELRVFFPNLQILEMEKFSIIDNNKSSFGLANNIYDSYKDFRTFVKLKDSIFNLKKTNLKNRKSKSVHPLFAVPPNAEVIIHNPRAKNQLTVLLIGDSFRKKISPYFNQSFENIIYLHRNKTSQTEIDEIVHKYKPDIVIFQYVERAFAASPH